MLRLQECLDAELNEREQKAESPSTYEHHTGGGGNGRNAFRQPTQRDFAKRFERGKLSFTGDVLQVISVFGPQ